MIHFQNVRNFGLNYTNDLKCLDMFFSTMISKVRWNGVQVTFTDIAEVVQDDLLNVYHLSCLG